MSSNARSSKAQARKAAQGISYEGIFIQAPAIRCISCNARRSFISIAISGRAEGGLDELISLCHSCALLQIDKIRRVVDSL